MATVRTYAQGVHTFFDPLSFFLAAFGSNLIVTEVLRTGGTKLSHDPSYYMQFEGCVEPVKLTWYPHATLTALAANTWPRTIELHEDTSHPPTAAFRLDSPEFIGLHARALQACFIQYFEAHRGQIETRCGSDPAMWPAVWNFARVVRNAFAHGGALTIRNNAASSVRWGRLSYSPADNG